jgi:hypothetical protein
VGRDSDRGSVGGERRDRLMVEVLHTRKRRLGPAIKLLQEPKEARVARLRAEPSEPASDRSLVARRQRTEHDGRAVAQHHPLGVGRQSAVTTALRTGRNRRALDF